MNIRKIVFWLHLTAGCLAGAVILIMSVTGVLLAYERQILNWVDRAVRSTPPTANAARMPVDTMIAGAVEQYGMPPTAITLRADPAAPAEVSFGRQHVALVDTYSGRVLGESSQAARSFFQKVEAWHRWLGVSDEHRATGRVFTGACNLAFLFIVISGPFLWLPRKWTAQSVKAIAWFRGGLSGKARDFNWHNVIGIWSALPLVVIVGSAVVMSYPWANNLVYRLTGSELPVQNGPRGEGPQRQGRGARPEAARAERAGTEGEGQHAAKLQPLFARAEQQLPDWRSITLRPPMSGRGPMTFTIDTGDGGRPDQRAQLTLNRNTADVIRWEPFSSYNTGRRVRAWLRFLHTGEAGGVAGETVAGIATAGAVVLVWTGIWLACRRLGRKLGRQNGGKPEREQAKTERYEQVSARS